MRKTLKIKGETYRINPELAAKVISRALKLFNGGKNWIKGGWIEIDGYTFQNETGTPGKNTGAYRTALENLTATKQKSKACFCAEGAVGLAAAELIPGFDRHSTQGRKMVAGILGSLAEFAYHPNATETIMDYNDSGIAYPELRKVFSKTARWFRNKAR